MKTLSSIRRFLSHTFNKCRELCFEPFLLGASLAFFSLTKLCLGNRIRLLRETMDGEGAGVGKKLGFIAQEMGREINTLGSKSNQSEMQIIVVKMKDILEQIKEQVLNVL